MFITFEGPDGSGKTTQITLLANRLRQQGHVICITREPGGTSIGEQIRDVLHNHKNTELAPRTEVLLYTASRAQLVAEVIRPALAAGKIVISDRYYDSTFAYQGYGHGLDLDMLADLTQIATDGLAPDLTFYFALEPAEGLRRRQQDDGSEWNRMDALAEDFHRRVAQGYHALMAREPERWVSIDASRPIEAVQVAVWQAVMDRLR
ncbi:MAG: dTMP kinase [Chloroflexi bacterium]|nr:dTMP kinase [Chloroflexota bacterium]